MPRTPEQLEDVRSRSREKILDAALELFAERGFATTSVRALAERAGVSQGLLYNYFDGKKDLLRAIFRRGTSQVQETFIAAEAADPSEALGVLVRSAFEAVRRNRQFWQLTYQLRMQPDVLIEAGPEIVSRAVEIRSRIEELLERTGVTDAAARATLLFASIDGAAQHFVLDPDHYPVDEVISEILRRLIPSADGRGGER